MKANSSSRLGLRTVLAACLFAASLLFAGASLAAQDSSAASSAAADDDMFSAPETVAPASTSSKEAEGQSSFLKYDQVKIGGSFTGKAGLTSVWASPWDGSQALIPPTSIAVTPDFQGDVKIVAKPLTDFGVNMDFRTSWPFTLKNGSASSAALPNIATASLSSTGTGTIPNIAVWSLYSKFNWQDRVYFSAGLQPIAWGVAKGYYQPADNIFAASSSIDPTNTGAERQGPISLKTTIPLGVTNNLYFLAGLPTTTDSSGNTNVNMDPGQTRFAVKGEYGFGNTELAAAAYYAYADHPRALLMGTTGIGSWNVFGEGILKYGSERYFVSSAPVSLAAPLGLTSAQQSGDFYFSGTVGGIYYDADSRISIIMQYYYNGEGQTGAAVADIYKFLIAKAGLGSSQFDNINFGTHYVFASISDSDLLDQLVGADKLGASVVVITNLSDLSGYVIPSISWKFFDYMSLQLGATLNFGPSGSEFISYGVGQSLSLASLPTKAGAALSLTLTMGTGTF